MSLDGLNVSPTAAGKSFLPIARWKWDEMTDEQRAAVFADRGQRFRDYVKGKDKNARGESAKAARDRIVLKSMPRKLSWREKYQAEITAQFALDLPDDMHRSVDDRAAMLATECTEFARELNQERVVAAVSAVMARNGVNPEKVQATEGGFIARALDPGWWKRQLRKVDQREFEQGERETFKVHGNGQLYVSDFAVMQRRQRDRVNCEIMDAITLESQDGHQATLFDLAKSGMANPKNRRHEMMTRIRGIDDWSKEQGMYAGLWTLTTPSRFHAAKLIKAKNGKREWRRTYRNKAYDNTLTPRHGQEWLCSVWARIRAAFARLDIRVHGLRAAEPHHDGTPHWHFVVFMRPDQVELAKAIFKKYATKDTPDEKGAWQRRADFRDIDPEKGSAAGYAAKYIAKAIGGFDLESDAKVDRELLQWAMTDDDDEAGAGKASIVETSERVATWASVWGIRQFQFFGLEFCPVGLWRQMRRFDDEELPAEFDLDLALDTLRMMADDGDFKSFIEAQRVLQAVLAKEQPIAGVNEETGEVFFKLNKYGELAEKQPVEIVGELARVPVVKNEWRVVEIDAARIRGAWSSGNNCTEPNNGDRLRRKSAASCSKNERIAEGPGTDADGEGRRNSASSQRFN